MGTLQHQNPRVDTIQGYVSTLGNIAEQMYPHKMQRDLQPEEWHAVAAITQAALAIQSADALDEQLAGFGEILGHIADCLIMRPEEN